MAASDPFRSLRLRIVAEAGMVRARAMAKMDVIVIDDMTHLVIERLFSEPAERESAAQLVTDAFADVKSDGSRLVYSVLRIACGRYALSAYSRSGRIDNLRGAIKLLHTDWRDLIVAAGFENDVEAHRNWVAQLLSEPQ